jgi:parvulin-like peptidyl-prolyl isomerase
MARAVRLVLDWVRRQPLVPAGRPARVVAVALLALLVVGSTTAVTLDRMLSVPDGSAFRVGGTLVTEQQLAQRVTLLGALYGVTPPKDPAAMDRFRRDTAKAIAVSDVLDDAATAKGIVIADKTANDQLTTVVERAFPQGRDAFIQRLASVGVTERDVVDEVKRQLADSELFKQVTAGVPTPTDQDVAQAYQQRHAQMAIPEKRHLRNIVVAQQDQANQIRSQLAAGGDFAALAAQSSQDDSTKAKGGDLGQVTRDQLDQQYGDAAFATQPNTVFGPVHSQYGWNVGQVLEVTPAVPLTLDQVRDQLRAQLLDERSQQVWNDWLGAQLRSAHVRYADAYRPADPNAPAPPPVPAR